MRAWGLIVALVVVGALSSVSGAGEGQDNWLALGEQLAQADARPCPTTTPADVAPSPALPYWKLRNGPAHPGDFWRSAGNDAKTILPSVWDDTKATFTNGVSLGLLAAAGVSGGLIAGTGLDEEVADDYDRRKGGHGSYLNTTWDMVGDVGGNPGTHFAIGGAMYVLSLAANDTANYEKSKTLINALAINGMLTLALKGAFNTESPNGDPFGWPSGHTSSSFCLATVLYNEYGPAAGLPALAFASFVGYERVDARNHDLSDVVGGAFIGVAVAHAVCQNHKPTILGMEVVPFMGEKGDAMGLALYKSW